MKHRLLWVFVLLCSLAFAGFALADRDDEEELSPPAMDPSPSPMKMPAKMRVYDFSADMMEGNLGATPGGAQDIAFARSQIQDSQIPHPNVFTPEGLLSEHDLPLGPSAAPCKALFCAEGEAVEARLLAQPEVKYLAQLGFSSGLSAETFKRAPLNLVAVIDKSGSMSGQPLDLVKKSLIKVVDKLNPDDQLTIVLYGDQVHAHLATTRVEDKKAVIRQIEAIESAGSTNMEAGLAMGFEIAKTTQKSSEGTNRVMPFTDERPNIGRTDAESFMGMAEAASLAGVGMTTVGVGVQFGAELATKISSVRGGNLFFFPDTGRMETVFNEDFDYMVTELAHDMKLKLKAPAGFKIAGIYGIPGDALKWGDDGALSLEIATIFLSKSKGAIYIGVASDTPDSLPSKTAAKGDPVVAIDLSYALITGEHLDQHTTLALKDAAEVGLGLRRGRLLVNEVTVLKQATALHHEKNDQVGAYKLVHELAELFRFEADPSLSKELELIEKLEHTLAKLAGYEGEAKPRPSMGLDPVSGLPR